VTRNQVLPEMWDEQVFRLAVGLRFIDGVQGGRPVYDAHVVIEDVPRPVRIPKPGPLGPDPAIGLTPMPTKRSGRFPIVYPVTFVRAGRPITVRVFHGNRRFVPRRLQVPFSAEAVVEVEDRLSRIPPFPPMPSRGHAVAVYPGATYGVNGTTGVRSRLSRADGTPVPWGRVWATTDGRDRVEGVAHADDRGEFVLLLRSTNVLLAEAPTVERDVVLHASLPPAVVDSPGDPALDPLAALPIEQLPPPGSPDPVSAGDQPPPGYAESPNTLTVTSRMGRVVTGPPFVV